MLRSLFYVSLLVAGMGQMSVSTQAQQPSAPGLFDSQSDVGAVKRPGSAVYDPAQQTYTVVGAGKNIWDTHDEFHYVWKRMTGDFILQTNGMLVGKGVDPHRKLGWMVRSGLDSSAAQVNAVVHGDGLTSLQFRRTKGAITEEKKSTLTGADVVQLARKGNTYTMSVARNGDLFTTETVDLDLGDEVYVGLFVCSHNPDVSEKAVFHNVRIVVPTPAGFVPYKQYLASRLEVMDVTSGHRRMIHQSPESLQAPNWTTDNKALIYNSNGKLYRFDFAKRTPSEINTGSVVNNNNDHVLSFNGKMLGLSNNGKEDGGKSIVYTVPVTGGTPKRVTPVGHSYLHGWSPDGKYLIYTGERNGDYDIYRIPVRGGEEVRLTDAKGLDDGSEYSPDGKYIYFNSVRSGTMQVWRMKADGSGQEQITNDDLNNWFPHISPDGKWMTILTFNKDVSPSDHPFYKHVYLRMMPVPTTLPAATPPKVIAYLYGGQGTINTPSWSPDSKRIGFISNSNSLDKPEAIGQ